MCASHIPKSTPTAAPSTTKDSQLPSTWGIYGRFRQDLSLSSEPTAGPQGSPASRSASQASGEAKTTSGIFGRPSTDSFARYDHGSFCWRTCQVSLLTTTYSRFSGTLPRAGTMRSGRLSALATLERPTAGTGCGSGQWPTATSGDARTWPSPDANWPGPTAGRSTRRMWPTAQARDGSHGGPQAKRADDPKRSNDLDDFVARAAGPSKGQLHPCWVEWLMGYPIGWTVLGR